VLSAVSFFVIFFLLFFLFCGYPFLTTEQEEQEEIHGKERRGTTEGTE
jgi:cytochrome c biogenesis factor